jgi:hypothetical protein
VATTQPLTDDRIQKMSDPNNHEIGLKKWMIDRISYEILAFKDTLRSSKDEFETVVNNWTSIGYLKLQLGHHNAMNTQ